MAEVPGTRHHRGAAVVVDSHEGGGDIEVEVWPDYFDMPAARRIGPAVLDHPHVRVEALGLAPEIAFTQAQARALARQLDAAADAAEATPNTRTALPA
ncbi:hypothetical protein DMB66_17820 [Actinoplanes sp. ATCC 53533]|uniref:hypothetical protein n=1 Tax=Actinoplanes sp. ATCC 53533 TaxID=1288362 RepID=UPI000F792AEE|nr:hypothetical protein [Actinoplanes sp. ATCC 53533]RSM65132.1 hypothetical protein DMB66_17820 [Actinoplanes sp. ATCC 53533]